MKRSSIAWVLLSLTILFTGCGKPSDDAAEEQASEESTTAEPSSKKAFDSVASTPKPSTAMKQGETDPEEATISLEESIYTPEPDAEASEPSSVRDKSDLIHTAVWYEAGTYKVGTDLPAGEYYIKHTEGRAAYFCLSSDSSGDDILYNGNPVNNYFITVSDGQYLQVKRGEFTLASEIPPLALDGILEEGMYRAGYDIPSGEYRATPHDGEKGYYCVYSDTASERSIVRNDNFEGNAYVTVSDGQYLYLSRCDAVLQ